MNNLRGVLGMRRIGKISNERAGEVSNVESCNERINKSVFRGFGYMKEWMIVN